jgi:class 3 adenylate cyclase
MRRRLTVIVMADMVDYSKKMEVDQANTIGLIKELREHWLEPEVARRGGEVLKRMGDGWMLAFGSVTDAVETSQAIQTALADHAQIRLRIAAHLGEITEDGTDFYGASVNIASRLQTEAPPGGVLISEDLHRQLDEKLAEEFSEIGSFELKNISRAIVGFQWRHKSITGATNEEIPTIAIEPVTTIPPQAEFQEAAADFQEQLAMRLSRRTGIRTLSLETQDSSEATYVLKSRLRVGGTLARLSLSLTLRESGRVFWSDAYEGSSDDIFDLVDLAAQQSNEELRQAINRLDGKRFDHLPDDALSASELRSRAAKLFYESTERSYERGKDLVERALRLAPDNPMSLAMWAHAWTLLLFGRFDPGDRELNAQIAARADAAAQANPQSDFVLKTQSEVAFKISRNLETAKRVWSRGLKVNPAYANFTILEIEFAVAEALWEKAADLCGVFLEKYPNNPHVPYASYIRAIALLMLGRFGEAARSLEEAISFAPSCPRFWRLLAEIRAQAGDSPGQEKALMTAAGLTEEFYLYAPALVLPDEAKHLQSILAPQGSSKFP